MIYKKKKMKVSCPKGNFSETIAKKKKRHLDDEIITKK